MELRKWRADVGVFVDPRAMEQQSEHADTDPRLRLRVLFKDDAMQGRGTADLLELIETHGSIAAAGRPMKMSCKRACMLVDEMNAASRDPLVNSTRGGQRGGGARLSDTGRAVVMHHRRLQELASTAGRTEAVAIPVLLRDMSERG